MEVLILFLLFVSVCCCVFLVFKMHRQLGDIKEDVSRLYMIPRGHEPKSYESAVTASGIPADMGAVYDEQIRRDPIDAPNLNGYSSDDMARIVQMVMDKQGGR